MTSSLGYEGPYGDGPEPYSTGNETRNHLQQSPHWTPGAAPGSTTAPGPKWIPGGVPTYPLPEPLKVGDVFTCPKCGGTIITTSSMAHYCPVSPQTAPEARGWLCPACGKGNAPFMPQCPCEGRGEASKPVPSEELKSKVPCDCCGINLGGSHKKYRGYSICENCFDHHKNYYNPLWHSGGPEIVVLPYEKTLKDGRPLRRYYFPDGGVYYNDDDSDDYK